MGFPYSDIFRSDIFRKDMPIFFICKIWTQNYNMTLLIFL